MKHRFVGAALGALTLAAAGSALAAHAYVLNPPATAFTASGSLALTTSSGSLSCTATLNGNTTRPAAVTSASFSGDAGCSDIVAAGLPWRIAVHGPSRTELTHVHLISPTLGSCGPNQVKAVLSGGTFSIQDRLPGKDGQCRLSTSLGTSPQVGIVGQQ